MSKRAYVLVKRGKVEEVARPLQGRLRVYPKDDSFVRPIVEWSGWGDRADGVWFTKLRFRKVMAWVDGEPKKVDVSKKVTQIDKKWGAGYAKARTGAPGIRGYQHRANAAASAQRSRAREAEGLLKWLQRQQESAIAMPRGVLLPEAGRKKRRRREVDFNALKEPRAAEIKPGNKMYLERVPVYARTQPPANAITVRTVAAVKRLDGGDYVVKFKSVKQRGFKYLRRFRMTVVDGLALSVWAGGAGERPVKYDVLGVE